MNLIAAIQTVVRDVWASYPHLSKPLAVKHALDTTSPAELNWEDSTAGAYYALHVASTAQVILALAKVTNVALDRGDVHEVDGVATIDGMNPYEWLDALIDSSL